MIKLLIVNAMRTFDFTIEARCAALDIDMSDAPVLHMPVVLGAEVRTVVRLNSLHSKGQAREHIIHKVDSVLLVVALVDPEHPQACAIIYGGELEIAFALARDGIQGWDLRTWYQSGDGGQAAAFHSVANAACAACRLGCVVDD